MIDKFAGFFIGHAQAQVTGKSFWDFFKPFGTISKEPLNATDTFQKVITIAMTWFLAIAAIIAFVYLVLNGINYITAGGDAEKATKARTGILNAIIGIVVVSLAFMIMRFALGVGKGVSGSTGSFFGL